MARGIRTLLTTAFAAAILALPPAPADAQAPGSDLATPSGQTFKPSRSRPARSQSRRGKQVIQQVAAQADDQDDTAPPRNRVDSESDVPAPTAGVPAFLESLPRPPDQPRSLLMPASPVNHWVHDLEEPYFKEDPLLDPPEFGRTGWFWDAQTSVVRPHIQNEMRENVLTGTGATIFVQPGNSPVQWTWTPRLEIGYRLPSGFGSFAIADAALNSNGTDTVLLPDGLASRSSSLQFNYTDFDYISREFTPWEGLDMWWRAGLRVAESYANTTIDQPFAQAAAGSGVVSQAASNATLGVGPHFAVELQHTCCNSGFSIVGKVDAGINYTTIRQRYSALTTTFPSPGIPDNGLTIDRFQNEVIFLTAQLGVAWTPASRPNTRVFLGYINETWWNALANNNSIQLGQFDYQGLALRASWNY